MAKKSQLPQTTHAIDAVGCVEGAISALDEVRGEYEEWQGNLPDNLQSSALADKLQEVAYLSVGSFDESNCVEALDAHGMNSAEVTIWRPSKFEKGGSRPKRWMAACAEADWYIHALIDLIDERLELLSGEDVNTDDLESAKDDLEQALNTTDEASGMDLPLGFGRD